MSVVWSPSASARRKGCCSCSCLCTQKEMCGKRHPGHSHRVSRKNGTRETAGSRRSPCLPRLSVTLVPAAASWSSIGAHTTTFLLPLVQSSFPHRMRLKPLILPFSPARSWSRQHLYSLSRVLNMASCYSWLILLVCNALSPPSPSSLKSCLFFRIWPKAWSYCGSSEKQELSA